MQMKLLMKALSYSAGVSLEWNVSMSLDPWSDSPPGRGRVVMLALTVEIQPVQWKRGWQLEKIHSQSERSAEAGMPTFQSSDRSTLGSVPGHSWPNARSGAAHSKAHLSSSQLWSMEALAAHLQYSMAQPQNTHQQMQLTDDNGGVRKGGEGERVYPRAWWPFRMCTAISALSAS